jgi:oligopeptide transport system permease protein
MRHLHFLSLLYLFTLTVLVIASPWLFQPRLLQPDIHSSLLSPGVGHFFGTDSLGRDLLARVIHGARVTLLMGIICTFISLFLGIVFGSLSGLLGGGYDQILMRILEIFKSLPQMVTIGFLVLFFSKLRVLEGEWSQVFMLASAVSLGSWMVFARLIRNQILREKQLPYVEAARAIGAHPLRQFYRHMLPNMAPGILVMTGLQLPHFLLFEGILSFIGIGIQPPTPSWGSLLQEGWKTLAVYPHLLLFPALVLFLTVFSMNVVFEKFRQRILQPMVPAEESH